MENTSNRVLNIWWGLTGTFELIVQPETSQYTILSIPKTRTPERSGTEEGVTGTGNRNLGYSKESGTDQRRLAGRPSRGSGCIST